MKLKRNKLPKPGKSKMTTKRRLSGPVRLGRKPKSVPTPMQSQKPPIPAANPMAAAVLRSPGLVSVEDAFSAKAGSVEQLAIRGFAGCLPFAVLTAANECERRHLKAHLLAELQAIAAEGDVEIVLQTQRFAMAPASKADIDIAATAKQLSTYKKAGVSSISRLLMEPKPLIIDPLGYGLQPVWRSFLIAKNVRREIAGAAPLRSRRPCIHLVDTQRRWIDLSQPDELSDAIDEFMARPRLKDREDSRRAKELGLSDWDAPEQRARRAVSAFQAEIQVAMQRQYVAEGRGRHILLPALKMAELRVAAERNGSQQVVHKDGVAHWCFKQLLRLGFEDQSVPFPTLR